MNDWFSIDRAGLAKILERRGRAWAIFELIQNALDTKAKRISVTLEAIHGTAQARLMVEDDDPDGFRDLTHAFTLFAPSSRAGDAETRGRFNFGCKMVLALCYEATVTSTTGAYAFTEAGRTKTNRRRASGSLFEGRLSMTRAEFGEVAKMLDLILVPQGVDLRIRIVNADGATVTDSTRRWVQPHCSFAASLKTEVANAQGYLERRDRTTTVRVHRAEGRAYLCELGIPVTPIDGEWTIDVAQKIPQGMDRDAVAPAYLAKVQTLTLNHVAEAMPPSGFTAPWVAEAIQHADVEAPAVDKYLHAKYGDRFVIADPSDPESNHKAVAAGFAVIRGGAEAGATWAKIKEHGLAKPAGQVFPSPKPSDDYRTIPLDELPENYRRAVGYARALARRLLERDIRVRVIDGPNLGDLATWFRTTTTSAPLLSLNRAHLGPDWFGAGPCVAVDDLLIHEMAHEGGHHLESGYHDYCTLLGAKGMDLARRDPNFFKQWMP